MKLTRDYKFTFRNAVLLILFLAGYSSHGAEFLAPPPDGESVSNLTAFYKRGQVFLTWQKSEDTLTYYKVYRSTSPITTGSDLASLEYLGYTNSTSAKDYDLSRQDKIDVYFVIDSGTAPLTPTTGLFVATTLHDGSYYYVVTTLVNGVENTAIVPGINTLQTPVIENVDLPCPVFQQTRLINNKPVDIYTTFFSTKYAQDQPPMNKAGFIANDFALFRNNATGNNPLRIHYHAGGLDFLDNVTVAFNSEVVISPEDYFPSGDNSSWWGMNENFDIYDDSLNTTPPVSGTNFNFGQQRMTMILNWAVRHLPIDTNRIYLEGTSFGAIGAYFYAMTYPERIAAVKLSVGVFNFSFQDDENSWCTLNTDNGNRTKGNNRLGTVSTNLMTNLGEKTYDMLNGGWLFDNFNDKPYPVIYSINGKNDTMVCWTEKTIYYDAVNEHHGTTYYFWDSRNHAGIGGTWGNENFDLYRYSRNESYPSFAFCSTNEDWGDGSATDGAPFGTLNGFLDWKPDITDDSTKWAASVFMRNLKKADGSIYVAPTSSTVDITPRRLQHFNPPPGVAINWSITYKGSVVQSGMVIYQGGVITIPDVTVYKDTVRLELIPDGTYLPAGEKDGLIEMFPNPSSNETTIRWQMINGGRCSLKVYDVQGRLVKILFDEDTFEGLHEITWNIEDSSGDGITSGVYLIRMETASNSSTGKLMVIR